MKAYRICAASLGRSRREAFSGLGGLTASARWHTRGRRIVYAAQSLSLAALETLVHLKSAVAVADFVSFRIEVPDELILKPSDYPPDWKSDRLATRRFGDSWLAARESPALVVPTAITPEEWNLLLNPAHPRFSLEWIAGGPDPYAFDERLVRRVDR